MEVWILFICGINVDTQAVKCHTARAPTQAICEFEADNIQSLVNAPMSAVCFSHTVAKGEPEST